MHVLIIRKRISSIKKLSWAVRELLAQTEPPRLLSTFLPRSIPITSFIPEPPRLLFQSNPELSSPAAGHPTVAARRIRRHLISAHHRNALSASHPPHQVDALPAASSTPAACPPPDAPPPPWSSAASRPDPSLTARARSSPSASQDEELARSRWCAASRASSGLPR
jgi:hypothetical protein